MANKSQNLIGFIEVLRDSLQQIKLTEQKECLQFIGNYSNLDVVKSE